MHLLGDWPSICRIKFYWLSFFGVNLSTTYQSRYTTFLKKTLFLERLCCIILQPTSISPVPPPVEAPTRDRQGGKEKSCSVWKEKAGFPSKISTSRPDLLAGWSPLSKSLQTRRQLKLWICLHPCSKLLFIGSPWSSFCFVNGPRQPIPGWYQRAPPPCRHPAHGPRPQPTSLRQRWSHPKLFWG